MAAPLYLIANPGSASRKYALYRGSNRLILIHFETVDGQVVYALTVGKRKVVENESAGLSHVSMAGVRLVPILQKHKLLESIDDLAAIGLRVVAPSSFFQQHRRLEGRALELLKTLETYAPLHINATLQEIELLSKTFPNIPVIGASDSAFHANKPRHAASYAISQTYAKQLDLWRYGYHGLSVSSVVEQLKKQKTLPRRLVVCHIGSGVSVTAVHDGKSIDNTMGYSPLEGTMMATRSGSVDVAASEVLARRQKLNDHQLQTYLNTKSGLLGVSGISSDIRELLEKEPNHESAGLALDMYVYRLQQAIGQMVAVLGGLDGLVFTGTVGERSSEMRRRITKKILYLGVSIDHAKNDATIAVAKPVDISQSRHPLPVFVVPADEASSILIAIKLLT